jgi:hypothetical protein
MCNAVSPSWAKEKRHSAAVNEVIQRPDENAAAAASRPCGAIEEQVSWRETAD